MHTVTVIEMNPVNYTFRLSNMSSEMVPFQLPVQSLAMALVRQHLLMEPACILMEHMISSSC